MLLVAWDLQARSRIWYSDFENLSLEERKVVFGKNKSRQAPLEQDSENCSLLVLKRQTDCSWMNSQHRSKQVTFL